MITVTKAKMRQNQHSRRDFLKAAGILAGAAALEGCAGALGQKFVLGIPTDAYSSQEDAITEGLSMLEDWERELLKATGFEIHGKARYIDEERSEELDERASGRANSEWNFIKVYRDSSRICGGAGKGTIVHEVGHYLRFLIDRTEYWPAMLQGIAVKEASKLGEVEGIVDSGDNLYFTFKDGKNENCDGFKCDRYFNAGKVMLPLLERYDLVEEYDRARHSDNDGKSSLEVRWKKITDTHNLEYGEGFLNWFLSYRKYGFVSSYACKNKEEDIAETYKMLREDSAELEELSRKEQPIAEKQAVLKDSLRKLRTFFETEEGRKVAMLYKHYADEPFVR